MASALKRSAGDADLSSVASDASDDDECGDDDSSLFDGSSGDATIRSSTIVGNGKISNGASQRPERSSDRKRRRGVIEKRRRDRINNSLCELRRLVPQAFEKQGNAKLEKAEILQLTVDYLRDLHHRQQKGMLFADPEALAIDYRSLGYRECMAEVARYLSLAEGLDAQDPMRLRLLTHLQCFSASCQPSSTPPLQPPPQQPTPMPPQHSSTPRMGLVGPQLAHQPPQQTPWDTTGQQAIMHNHFANGNSPGSYNPTTPDQSPAGQNGGYGIAANGYSVHLPGSAPTPNGGSAPSPYNSTSFMAGGYPGQQQQFVTGPASNNNYQAHRNTNPVLQNDANSNNNSNAKWCQLISAGLAAAYDTVPLSSTNDNHPQAGGNFTAANKLASAMGENASAAHWQQQLQQQHHQAMLNGIVKPEQLLF